MLLKCLKSAAVIDQLIGMAEPLMSSSLGGDDGRDLFACEPPPPKTFSLKFFWTIDHQNAIDEIEGSRFDEEGDHKKTIGGRTALGKLPEARENAGMEDGFQLTPLS